MKIKIYKQIYYIRYIINNNRWQRFSRFSRFSRFRITQNTLSLFSISLSRLVVSVMISTMSLVSSNSNTSTVLKVVTAENTEKKNAHAEQNALKKLISFPKKMKNISLLVIRMSKNGTLGESRPCYHCLSAMERSKLNIKWIYYSTKEGTIVREKFVEMKCSDKTYISSGNRNSPRKNRSTSKNRSSSPSNSPSNSPSRSPDTSPSSSPVSSRRNSLQSFLKNNRRNSLRRSSIRE